MSYALSVSGLRAHAAEVIHMRSMDIVLQELSVSVVSCTAQILI